MTKLNEVKLEANIEIVNKDPTNYITLPYLHIGKIFSNRSTNSYN